MIGYISLAVGWLVGKAMMKGSGGLGGRRYQIVAVLFTYAAVSIAAIPIAIAESSKAKKAQTQSRAQNPEASNGAGQSSADEGGQPPSSAQQPTHVRRQSFASAIGYLALIGLASPFLELGSDPFHGLIGLVILMVGIRFAWRMSRGHPPLVVDGPF
jgi:hypothetical protein